MIQRKDSRNQGVGNMWKIGGIPWDVFFSEAEAARIGCNFDWTKNLPVNLQMSSMVWRPTIYILTRIRNSH